MMGLGSAEVGELFCVNTGLVMPVLALKSFFLEILDVKVIGGLFSTLAPRNGHLSVMVAVKFYAFMALYLDIRKS